ncbi:MAG TPA: glycerol-3-phosphate 1-O-acyltransferase PlsY [Acidimicrobiia bacterium]|nr:glycerol-3-phosphate 1-O-acyltransferase PlsY [Acidimicrobiia bacterium]
MVLGVSEALAVVLSYLIGSVDFAVVVARMHGVNIHEVGSGNPGATNVMRALGKGPAVMVFVGDALKGVIAAAIGTFLSGATSAASPWAFAAGLAAVLGHCYPLYHRFRGGKGVATSAGVVFFTLPLVGLILTVIWAVVARLTRVSSIASLTVVVASVPLALWQGLAGPALVLFVAILLLVIYRHRGNISRILHRREQKVTP